MRKKLRIAVNLKQTSMTGLPVAAQAMRWYFSVSLPGVSKY